MSSAPMKLLLRFGHKPHPIDRKKYGQPRFALYWANRRRFIHPGVHLWTGNRHLWVVRLPRGVAR